MGKHHRTKWVIFHNNSKKDNPQFRCHRFWLFLTHLIKDHGPPLGVGETGWKGLIYHWDIPNIFCRCLNGMISSLSTIELGQFICIFRARKIVSKWKANDIPSRSSPSISVIFLHQWNISATIWGTMSSKFTICAWVNSSNYLCTKGLSYICNISMPKNTKTKNILP